MANVTSKRGAALVQKLKRLQDGDNLHANDSPLPPAIRRRLDAVLVNLEATLARTVATKAAAHEATQDQRKVLKDTGVALTAFRNSVLGMHPDTDKVVEDYGLHARKKAKPRVRKPKPVVSSTVTTTTDPKPAEKPADGPSPKP